MEYITDSECNHAKRIYKDFETKNLCEYHDLYLITLLLADIFENFRKMCLEIYKLDPAKFCSARISLTSSFKNDKKKVRIVNL